MIEILLLSLATAYAVGLLFAAIGALLSRYPTDPAYQPRVSVIIAARNEANNIRRCLDAVTRIRYPHELLEVIVVNDRSSDATPDIVREYAARDPSIKLFHTRAGGTHLPGKANAISQGIAASTGDIIVMTDADCAVPPGWVERTVSYYTDGSVGIVPGFTAIRSRNLFEAVQTIDWFVLFSVAAGANRLGFPLTAVGNNFSVRRKAYDAVGGYEHIPFSITEDYALFHAVTFSGTYCARFPLDAATLVESEPCPTWRELYRQRKRWFTGGRDMGVRSITMFAGAWLFHALLLCLAFLEPGLAVGAAAGMKVAADFLVMVPSLRAFKRWDLLLAFPLYEIYFFLYVLVLPVIVLGGAKVVWKERSFRAGKMQQPS